MVDKNRGYVQTHVNPENGLAERRAYTIEEVAQLMGCNKVTVYRKLYRGELKVLKGFGRLMVPAGELDRYLNQTVEYTPRRIQRTKKLQGAAA